MFTKNKNLDYQNSGEVSQLIPNNLLEKVKVIPTNIIKNWTFNHSTP